MSLVKSTIRLLKSYNSILTSIENIQDEIKNMEYTGMKTSKIDGMPYSPSGASITEIEALIMIAKKTELKKLLNKNTTILRIIDRAIDSLLDKERDVIVGFYIEKRTWDEIGEIVAHSPRHCLRIRDEALVKMSEAIYGHFELMEK